MIEQFDGNFGAILPLNKFLLRHAKQFQSLAENVKETGAFQKFQKNVYERGSQLLSEFIDRLTNDTSRYVPEDGTVHHIASNTVNFLKMLAREKATILQIFGATSTNRMQSQTNFSKLFGMLANISRLFSSNSRGIGSKLEEQIHNVHGRTIECAVHAK